MFHHVKELQFNARVSSSLDDDRVTEMNRSISTQRSREISAAVPKGENQWSSYPQETLESPRRVK